MRPMRVCGGLAVVAACCAGLGTSTKASGQCIGYTVAPGAGAFVPGTADIGLHADDAVLSIPLPFPVNFYGMSYSNATVSTNGTLKFTTNSTSYTNGCLPSATFAGPVIFPFWDDLYTTDTASG